MAIARDVTAIRQLKLRMEQEMMEQKVQEQKRITRAVIRAQEKERNKIGQELHDNVNQLLASTRIYLSMVRNSDPEKMELITKSIEFIDNAVHEIRMLSKKHVTPQKSIHLEQLTQCLIDTLQENAGLDISFSYQLPDSLEPQDDLKLNIYRVIQEQLTNICKHASAGKVEICIGAEGDHIFISVSDDGKGFEVEKNRKGVGISNIINRVESYNGRVSLESRPGNGCRLDIKIPLVLPDGNF
jgi:signal transduction histidine kinase